MSRMRFAFKPLSTMRRDPPALIALSEAQSRLRTRPLGGFCGDAAPSRTASFGDITHTPRRSKI